MFDHLPAALQTLGTVSVTLGCVGAALMLLMLISGKGSGVLGIIIMCVATVAIGCTAVLTEYDDHVEGERLDDLGASLTERHGVEVRVPRQADLLGKPMRWKVGDQWTECYLSDGKLKLNDQYLLCWDSSVDKFVPVER